MWTLNVLSLANVDGHSVHLIRATVGRDVDVGLLDRGAVDVTAGAGAGAGLLDRGGVDVTAADRVLDLVPNAGDDGLELASSVASNIVGVVALELDLVLGESNRVGVAALVRDLVDIDGELQPGCGTKGNVGVVGLQSAALESPIPRALVTTGVDDTKSLLGNAD